MKKRIQQLLTAAIALALMLVPTLAATVSASPTFTEYSIPGSYNTQPWGITTGPDGNLWFTEFNTTYGSRIGKITPSGTITEYPLPDGYYNPEGITSGPDGALWFTGRFANNDGGYVGRITISGSITIYPTSSTYFPLYITTGSDGALWYTESINKIGRITTSGSVTEYSLPTAGSSAEGITAGPDGNIWFAEYNGNKIGRITTSGNITEYSIPTANVSPYGITTGPDGALWFTESAGNGIGRVTTSGTVTEYTIPTAGTQPWDITTGPDGALWFTENSGKNNIGRITTSGDIAEYQIPTASSDSHDITTGLDGALWFTEESVNQIGRLSLAPSAPTNLTAPSPTQNPSLSWDSVTGAASYNIYRNGTKIDSTTNTTYTDNSAPEGTDSYYVTAVDSSGNESSPSNTINVVVDRTRPVVTVTPVAGSTLSGTETFDITVTDNNPLDPSKNKSDWVYLYDTAGAQKHLGAKVDLSSGSGTFTIDTTQLDNGNANLDVGIVYDAAGNASGTSDNYFRNYTIDN